MQPRISTITLGVADLPRAIRFYRDGLGFPTQVEDGAPIAFFTTDGTRLILYPMDQLADYVAADAPPPRQFGGICLSHNVRRKSEVAKILARAKKAGGKIIRPAKDVFWGGHSGIFTDPDSHYWEVAWAPMFSFDASGALLFEKPD